MKEVQNPFGAPPASHAEAAAKARAAWIIAALMAVVAGAALIYCFYAVRQVHRLAPLRGDLDDALGQLSNALQRVEEAGGQVTNLQAQIADLQKQRDAVGQAAHHLEDEMRSDLESKDVTISRLQGKLTVNILDRVLFDSGEAELKPDGEAVLRKIASLLAEHPGIKIQVVGHTDNVPVHERFRSNWELSTARALAAVHFLTEQAGVDPSRVGAAGYGEYRPVADNSTPEGRARNRRIAITILSDELAGVDATAPATNALSETSSSGSSDSSTNAAVSSPAP